MSGVSRRISILVSVLVLVLVLTPAAFALRLTSIQVTPTSATIAAGSTQQFKATGTYSTGATKDITNSVTWTSSATAVATIASGGLATGKAAGTTQIKATSGSVSGSATLTVTAPTVTLTSITVTPANSSIVAGKTQQFTATGNYSNGTSAVLSTVTWASSATAVATITVTGLATGVAAGTTVISAASGGVTGSTNLTVTVVAPTLTSITVTPANASIGVGATQQYAATGTFSDGSTQMLTSTAAWGSSAPQYATISSAGLATGVAAGSTTISATSATVSGSTTLTVADNTLHHYEYVFTDYNMYVYDRDNGFALLKQVSLPNVKAVRGVAANPSAHLLYLSYGGDGGGNGNGSMLAWDLLTDTVVWNVNYSTGIDSMAISPDGSKLYLPDGELTSNGIWDVVDAGNGSITGTINTTMSGPHNTIVGLSGAYVYMGPRYSSYLSVGSTSTNQIVRQIGPLLNGVRPFTINGKETLAFTTASNFIGFQVSSITTGAVLYTVQVAGFSIPSTFTLTAPSHGISLSPDEKEIYLIDAANSYVHVFDVTGLPGSAPVQVADIPVSTISGSESACSYDCGRDGWIRHSRDGQYVFVGDCGDVIETSTRRVVANLPSLHDSRKYIEIDWQNGAPVSTSTRSGLGYVQ